MSLLTISGLQKSFAGPAGDTTRIIDIDTFELAPETHLALRGRSGSGKTTFLHLIAGILPADAGSICFDGIELSQLSEARRDRVRATNIGYIFQTFNLLQGYTALENVLLGMAFSPGGIDRKRAVAMLDRVGLSDRLSHRPRELSTGQQQRVAVARALAKRPRLVLADEPTGNLDRRNADNTLSLIREVCTEDPTALLLVSHDDAVLAEFPEVVDFSALNPSAMPTQP
ncbi:ABC transporter ATP-binding protein [Synoicihabitans lomoniglobus]|uniref:ABC transporter ATP-binding protein n=1 Tax=Synoicihabitans lomoniglobus TaxID=2909285 RepID=A0AAF0I1T2_9BACT|nr:ABC transporter ATP-binding protein [Opitutaceae bacterium LMO-M01]WED66012.1 ABC transporter ATP-binding protein [Opitutaceae bacterium LMO-M01]